MVKPRQRESDNTLQSAEVEMIEAVIAEGFGRALAEQIVSPIVRHLADRYAGERIYIPAPKREYPAEEIREAMTSTGNADAVCERFGISRRTLYRILGKDAA